MLPIAEAANSGLHMLMHSHKLPHTICAYIRITCRYTCKRNTANELKESGSWCKDWEELAQNLSREEKNNDISEPGFPEHSQYTQE